jgi:carnitine-CoA ligase
MSRLPPREDVVVRSLLEHGARERPDELLVRFDDGTVWTRRQALEQALAAANVLRERGVQQDDRVAVLQGNGEGFLRTWWGINCLGAVMVPINVAFRGSMLQRVLELSEPAAIVVDDERRPRLDEAAAPPLETLSPGDLIGADATSPRLDRELESWDHFAWILTSGTTGPSKLSATTYHQIHCAGMSFLGTFGADERDVTLIDVPLFHLAALFLTVGSLATRARFAVRPMPALSAYWEVARETQATISILLSTMVPYLLSQPERPDERKHNLRLLIASPLPADLDAFQARFAIPEFTTAFGMTEVPGAIMRGPGQPLVAGSCGRVRAGFEVRLVDEHDLEVPVGAVGELVIRTDQPWTLSAGYVKDHEATARAWRNGWFHTGDLLRCDAEGNFFYVDRLKDAIRRRGENISTFEVEAEVAAHPAVAEVACVGVRSDTGVDDEVKVWIVPADAGELEFDELLRFCAERMPHFMVPRYYELIDALPKTPSARVRKHTLRERGNGPDTWDREAHGWKLGRGGLARPQPAVP